MNAAVKNHPYWAAAERALERGGGFYTMADILEGVKTGQFQSFSNGESWAVTRVAKFPRRTALEVVFMMGTKAELEEMESELIGFARDNDADIMYALGRPGYMKEAFEGWKMSAAMFIKDLTHG